MGVAGSVAAVPSAIVAAAYHGIHVDAGQAGSVTTEKNDRAVLSFVKAFMTGFTTLDPFHANAYIDRILAHATGDFAKQYHDKQNEILVRIAQAEPAKGTAGRRGGTVERRRQRQCHGGYRRHLEISRRKTEIRQHKSLGGHR